MAAADYDEVFSKWKYQYATDKDGSQVRRYNGLVYTRWKKDGTFDKFVDAMDGVALFRLGYKTEDAHGRPIPKATRYFAVKKRWGRVDSQDNGWLLDKDPEGCNIIYFLDMYGQETKTAL